MDVVHYQIDGSTIRCLNFVDTTTTFYEPISSLMDDNEDYHDGFACLASISIDLAKAYLKMIWLDSIVYNVDRHTENFGLLRDAVSGTVLSMTPLFDHNIALISRGHPKDVTRQKDGLIHFFRQFVHSNQTA